MPRDGRLFMTFPNDFPWHYKVQRLPVEAKWAFVEMNGYSRMNDLDGVIPAEDADFMWTREVMDQLVASHPSRPLVVRQGENYVLRDYGEHQQTKAERERLAEVSRANGAKGGRPRKNPTETQPGSGGNPAEPGRKQSPESRVQKTDTYLPESSHEIPASVSTDAFEMSEVTKMQAAQAGIRDLAAIAAEIRSRLGIQLNSFGTLAVANHLLGKSRNYPDVPDRYVLGCLSQSPAEIEQFIYDSSLAPAA